MEEQSENGFQETSGPKPSIWKQAITYGIYFAILSILLTVILYATGSMMSKSVQYISILIMIIAIIIIQLHYRKSLGGDITYGKSLTIAVLSMLFAGIPIAIFTYVLYAYIDPALIEQIRLATEEKLVEQGRLSQEQINATMAMTSKFQTPGIMGASQLLNTPLIGLIIGLITSIFIKKESVDKIFE